MKINFWGTRGSIARSGPDTIRYGGNTSCVEIRSDNNDLLILDAGTGLHKLSTSLLKEKDPLSSTSILISHTHWDHIQGLPFFTPFFIPGQDWNLYGPSTLSQDLETILKGQMQQTYFPITPDIFNANMNYHNVSEGSFEVGDIKVTTHYLNHPGVTIGYRIEVDGYTIVYSTDHEPHDCRLAHGGTPMAGSEDALHGDFIAQADYLIHDTQYLAKEYGGKRGWGHSTMEYVVDLAHHADVKNLLMFHHDPLRTDQEIDHVVETAQERIHGRPGQMQIMGASEQIPIQPTPKRLQVAVKPKTITDKVSALNSNTPLTNEVILYYSQDKSQLTKVIEQTGHYGVHAETKADLISLSQQYQPCIIFLKLAEPETLDSYYQHLSEYLDKQPETKVVLLCQANEFSSDDHLQHLCPLPIRLVEPVSDIYLSSRLQTWTQRVHSLKTETWTRAPIPFNDLERAKVSKKLLSFFEATNLDKPKAHLIKHLKHLLDLAWQVFMIPSKQNVSVAVNLITESEQYTAVGTPSLTPSTCHRDIAFCSYVIYQEAPIISLNIQEHPQFKYQAEFTQDSKEMIMTYLGFPLKVNGHCIGTLCCQSTQQIQMQEGQEVSLEGVAKLIEDTLELLLTL